MPTIGLDLTQFHGLFDADPVGMITAARVADEHGIGEVHVGDHVAISRGAVENRAAYPWPYEYPWFEPLTALSAIAAQTQRVRLVTSVLIAPLRPAVFLAKQAATLDVISGGRAELGLGIGWQAEEFAASGIPFTGRRRLIEEQIAACRELWTNAPASFDGRRVRFRDLYSLPLPPQGPGLPILLGGGPTETNFRLIAHLASGWLAQAVPPGEFALSTRTLRETWDRAGRSTPCKITLKMALPTVESVADQIALARDYFAAGADTVVVRAPPTCRTASDLVPFIDKVATLSTT